MFCTKCGASISDTDTVCPACNSMIMQVHDAGENNNQANEWEKYQIEKEQLKSFGFNKYLAWSVATCLCCIPFGIINVVLLHSKIKPLIKEGNIEKANKLKPLMVVLIIVGFLLGIVSNIISILLELMVSYV